MKKFTYLSILLFTLTMVSCTDTNVLVPTVTSGNQDWQLESKYSVEDPRTTVISRDTILKTTYSENGDQILFVTHYINTDSKCEMKPYPMIVNNGKSIELTYRDESPIGSVSLGSQKTTIMRHYFYIKTKGAGTGINIPVIIRTVYPNPNLGVNNTYTATLLF